MYTQSSKFKAPSRAALLVAVYALHLLFFQVLLSSTATFCEGRMNYKPLFSTVHEMQSPRSHAPKHPAATYFGMLSKQGSASMHSETESPEVFMHTIKIATLQIIDVQQYINLPDISICQSDCLFALYRLVNVFLI